MKLIAHRGLTNGPSELENRPDQIEYALRIGFDCEIDLWRIDGRLFLGHDNAQYETSESFINNSRFWIHAKNLEALHFLSNHNSDYHYFWHENDSFVITNRGFIWTYPKKPLTSNSICVMPELFMSFEDAKKIDCYGICSDFVEII